MGLNYSNQANFYIDSFFSLQIKCTFTKVFADDVGQSEVFNDIGLPLIEDLLGGRNG